MSRLFQWNLAYSPSRNCKRGQTPDFGKLHPYFHLLQPPQFTDFLKLVFVDEKILPKTPTVTTFSMWGLTGKIEIKTQSFKFMRVKLAEIGLKYHICDNFMIFCVNYIDKIKIYCCISFGIYGFTKCYRWSY